MNHRQRLIDDAHVPHNSQIIRHVPKARKMWRVSHVGIFGDHFFVIFDVFDPWESHPHLQFIPVIDSNKSICPKNKLTVTRHVLGVKANFESREVVCGHFIYTKSNQREVHIDIYTIDEAFRAVLQRTIVTDAMDVAGSGLSGCFSSPAPGEYVAVWGDASNDESFFVFRAQSIDSASTSREFKCTTMTVAFSHLCEWAGGDNLSTLYPVGGWKLLSCLAYDTGTNQTDCIAILLLQGSHRNEHFDLEKVFERVVKLPFHRREPETNMRASVKTVLRLADGSTRCHVRVSVGGIVTVQSGGLEVDAVMLEDAQKRSCVDLLLSLPTNQVLDMYLHDGCGRCTIHASGDHLVRFHASDKPDKKLLTGVVVENEAPQMEGLGASGADNAVVS